jgi:hypothetical protein
VNGAHDHRTGGHEHLSHVPRATLPAVFAARADLVLDPPEDGDGLEAMAARFFEELSAGLADAGCTLVGHVKGTLAAPGRGDLTFHATMLGAGPALTGGFAGTVSAAALTVNVIVFGVEEATLPALVHDAWSRAAGAETVWR